MQPFVHIPTFTNLPSRGLGWPTDLFSSVKMGSYTLHLDLHVLLFRAEPQQMLTFSHEFRLQLQKINVWQ
jgi:hypothetical protein